MQLEAIRSKYQEILEEPESQNSEDQWQEAYSRMQLKRRRKILGEATMALNASQRLATGKSTEGMLQLKEKLAQSLINIAEKDREIAELREECDKQCEANSQLEEVVASLKEELQETGKTIEETKSAYADLVSQHEQCHLQVESNSIDQGLLLKQIQFYKQEIDVLKQELQSRNRQSTKLDRQIKQLDKTKQQNSRLKDDLTRLMAIIDDSYRFGRVSQQLLKRHFLGKPFKQFDYWYPGVLVGQVECFLKKYQVGCGNKEFVNELIKFIEGYADRKIKDYKLKNNNKSKDRDRQYRSISVCSASEGARKTKMSEILLRKQSIGLSDSYCRGIADSRATKQSKLIIEVPSHNQRVNRKSLSNQLHQSCMDILQQFASVMERLLNEKVVKRKQMKKIIESMINHIMEVLDGNRFEVKLDRY